MIVNKKIALFMLDNMVTDHSRTSCSDEKAVNGYGSSSGNYPRCNRCLLLHFVRDGFVPSDEEINCDIGSFTWHTIDTLDMKKSRLADAERQADQLRKQILAQEGKSC